MTNTIKTIRSLVFLMLAAAILASHFESQVVLSSEANNYREMVRLLRSGLSIKYLLANACFLLSLICALIGSGLLFFGKQHGTVILLIAAPLLGASTLLTEECYFPRIEPAIAGIFWCICSAAWGGIIAFTVMEKRRKPIAWEDAREA